jgi:hypothetical protein
MLLASSGLTDHNYSGFYVSLTYGTTIALFNVLYIGSGGTLLLADCSSVSSSPGYFLATEAGSSGSHNVLCIGFAKDNSWAWTPGGPLYLASSGLMSQVMPVASGNQVQILGIAISSTLVYFNPTMATAEVR